jgi:hypothetical protein
VGSGGPEPDASRTLEGFAVSPFDHIEHPRKRAYLRALATHGRKMKAAQDAGVHEDTPYLPGWRFDQEFQEAKALAEAIAAERIEDEAVRRAVEGLKRYRFSKDGEPLKHPVTGEPYFEHEYSDHLLQFLLKGQLPHKYGAKLHLTAALANFDMSRLPDHLIDRLAAWEEPLAVLASAAQEGHGTPGELLGVEVQEEQDQKSERPPASEETEGRLDEGIGEEL